MKGLGRRMIVISGCSAIELKLTGAEIIRFECFKDCQFELFPYQRDFAITGSFAVCFR